MNPGDALLMYSDGLTEAESPDGQPFDEAGLERTLALFAGAYQKTAAAELGKAVFDAVERHRRDQRLQDDLTVLVLSRLALDFVPAGSNSSQRGLIRLNRPDRPGHLIPDPTWSLQCLQACCLLMALSSLCPHSRGRYPSRALDDEDLSIQAFPAGRRDLDLDDGSGAVDWTCCRPPPIGIRRSSSSRRWSRRASRASSSRSAIDRRCRARCPAKATGSSSKSSWRPARAAASRRGVSTSAVRAATTSAASRGASSSQDRLASIEGLHRLSLHPEKQFAAKNLVLKAIDFELRLPSGDVFVAETPEGVTAIVLLGEGTMVFQPAPKEETRPAEAVRRRRSARDAVHLGVRAAQSVRIRAARHRRHARAGRARQPRLPPRPGRVRRRACRSRSIST